MTLIISFKANNFSILLGDLLLTTEEKLPNSLDVPSVGKIPAKYNPYGLSRKVCQFSNIALVWAGYYNKTRPIIRNIYQATKAQGPLTLEKLDNVFSNLSHKSKEAIENKKVSLLGYLINPLGGENFGFGVNYEKFNSSLISDVKIAGSGAKLFRTYLDHKSPYKFMDSLTNIDDRDNNFGKATAIAFSLVGSLLQLEIGTHKTFENYFGGGYEILFLKDNRFISADDVISVFFYAQINDEVIMINPVMKIIKQMYYNDFLVIRTLEMKSQDPNNFTHFESREDHTYFVGPIYRDVTLQEIQEISALPKLDLRAFMLCTYGVVESKNGIEHFSKMDWSKNRELPIRFIDEGGKKMAIEIQTKYLENILDAIRTRK